MEVILCLWERELGLNRSYQKNAEAKAIPVIAPRAMPNPKPNPRPNPRLNPKPPQRIPNHNHQDLQ